MNVKMLSEYICYMCEFSMTPLFLYLHYFCKNKTHKNIKRRLQIKHLHVQCSFAVVYFCSYHFHEMQRNNYGATCTSVRPALVL